jgi:hypothetical protein
LQEKKDELLLRELLKRWSNHKIMTCWLSKFFRYLDRYYTPKQRLPSLEETGFLSFYYLVGDEIPLTKMLHYGIFFGSIFCFPFVPLFNSSFTSFYLSQVYDGIHRQVMDAILAMVFSVFQFYVIYNQFIYQFIIIIDENFFGLTNQGTVYSVCQLSNMASLLSLNFFDYVLRLSDSYVLE